MSSGEILIEIHRIGGILRIAAVDAVSGTEIVFQAPSSTSPSALQRLAASKLRYVREREAQDKGKS